MQPELVPYEVLAKEMLRRVFAEDDPAALHSWIQESLMRLGGNAQADDSIMTWQQSFDIYDEILEARAMKSAMPPQERKLLDWKWDVWNEYIDPLEPGMLAVLSAPDGGGKSLYSEEIAEHWARRRNRVVFVHFELNRAIMLDRRAVRHTSIPRRVLQSGLLDAEQLAVLNKMRPELLEWDGFITYLHTPGWSMDRVVQELRRLHSEGICDAVVLDYLEKCSASQRQIRLFGQNVYQREADNVETIKNFAEAAGVPVLMLTQMGKASKTASIENIDRTSMRGAGEKSEKANLVVLLQRERTSEGGYSNMVNVLIDKNTMGRTGQFTQMMEPEFFRINNSQQIQVPLQADVPMEKKGTPRGRRG